MKLQVPVKTGTTKGVMSAMFTRSNADMLMLSFCKAKAEREHGTHINCFDPFRIEFVDSQ